MADEAWIDRSAVTDEEWFSALEQDFGLNVRLV